MTASSPPPGRKHEDTKDHEKRRDNRGAEDEKNFGDEMDLKLLELVVCPITHSRLRVEGEELVSEMGGVRYPIREGLPVLLPEAAKLPEGVTVEELRKMANDK